MTPRTAHTVDSKCVAPMTWNKTTVYPTCFRSGPDHCVRTFVAKRSRSADSDAQKLRQAQAVGNYSPANHNAHKYSHPPIRDPAPVSAAHRSWR